MPELPEVETVRRALEARLVGRRFTVVETRRPDLRGPLPRDLKTRLLGRTVTAVDRRAKYLLVRLDDGATMIAHLGMSGRMLLHDRRHPAGPHDHVILGADDGTLIYFNDARRFGLLTLADAKDVSSHPLLRDLGIEPLGPGFNADTLWKALRGRKTSIKAALLDQRLVAGIGNIYACEALFRAGISPRRRTGSLSKVRCGHLAAAIRAVLTDAIAAGGATLRDHRQPDGELGYFQHDFSVYDRAGLPCPGCTCGAKPDNGSNGRNKIKIGRGTKPGIRRIVQGGRSTFYCPTRQR